MKDEQFHLRSPKYVLLTSLSSIWERNVVLMDFKCQERGGLPVTRWQC